MDAPTPPPDDALAQPARAALFALLGELKRPAQTGELAERVGLHINGVRIHLEQLRAAGLVTRTRVRQPIGRPRDEWAIASGAHPGGQSPRAYADLGRWLARIVEAGTTRPGEIEAAGREIGREIAPSGGQQSPEEAMQTSLAAMGFQPRRRSGRGRRVVFCLENCPYRDAVRESQAVICTLHRGLTRGLLDALQPSGRLVDFVPLDPDRAGCLIELDGLTVAHEDRSQ